jgi:hypothetical protein
LIYKVFINLLYLRAIGFIKSYIHNDLNTTGGFVVDKIGMFVSTIIK